MAVPVFLAKTFSFARNAVAAARFWLRENFSRQEGYAPKNRFLYLSIGFLVLFSGFIFFRDLFHSSADRLEKKLSANLFGAELADASRLDPIYFATYSVIPEDHVWLIAYKLGKNIDTIFSVNDIRRDNPLYVGQKLRIPHIDGIYQTFREGQTLESIASNRGISVSGIRRYNHLTQDETPTNGAVLFLPGARYSRSELIARTGTMLRTPIPNGWFRITSPYGWRYDPFTGEARFHYGIDLGAAQGTPVYSASSGTVVYASPHSGYGLLVAIEHPNGFVTRYAHLDRTMVKVGDSVRTGSQIAAVGTSGRATGPHLYFEVLQSGRYINPLDVTDILF